MEPRKRHPLTGAGRATLATRWIYYLSSIPTLLVRVRSRVRMLAIFLGAPIRKPVTLELDTGCRLRVETRMDVWTVKETCLDLVYETRGAVRDGWTVLDVGAGLGDFATSVARRHPSATVLAFEPLPHSYALLVENVELNGLTNVRTFREAVLGHEGVTFLSTPTGLSGQHQTSERPADEKNISAPSTTLARALERAPGGRCDFLKVDCEGGEYDILLTADEQTLSRVGQIAMEYHDEMTPHTHGELVERLGRSDFDVWTTPSPAHRGLGYLYAVNRREPRPAG